jgi:nitrile hydratase subunit beta
VGERFRPGEQVRASRTDPAHHTRIPRYVRGAVGTVVATEGRHPLPDLRSRGLPAEPEPVYGVRFTARELFGAGDHTVTIALWESYLEAAAPTGYQAEHP